jgi:hypothetical protein
MPRSRTIITLSSLLAAMTVGTFALLALETSPAQPSAIAALAARETSSPLDRSVEQILDQTDIPLQVSKWTSIIIHDSAEGPNAACVAGSHFFVDFGVDAQAEGPVYRTVRWAQQASGPQALVVDESFNSGAISVCLAGDLSVTAPAPEQMAALSALVRSLQGRLSIAADHVYLHGDLTGTACPGRTFPAESFRRTLR